MFAGQGTQTGLPTLPLGVTLQAIDGETLLGSVQSNNYFSRNGWTNAVNMGMDNVGHIPIGVFLFGVNGTSDLTRILGQNVNTLVAHNANSSMSLVQGKGIAVWRSVVKTLVDASHGWVTGGGTWTSCTTSGTTLTVGARGSSNDGDAAPSGNMNICLGDIFTGGDGANSLPANTTVVQQLTGSSGSTGTYQLSHSATPGNLTSCTLQQLPNASFDVGYYYDEPLVISDFTNSLQALPQSQLGTRFFTINATVNTIKFDFCGTNPGTTFRQTWPTSFSTQRGLEFLSMDLYWLNDAVDINSGGGPGALNQASMTFDQSRRGSLYGDLVNAFRGYCNGTKSTNYTFGAAGNYSPQSIKPLYAFIDEGGPDHGGETGPNGTNQYTTPLELNWNIWSQIVNGARAVMYFNHTGQGGLAGPIGSSNDDTAEAYFQSDWAGQGISTWGSGQAQKTNALVLCYAPVIKSPTMLSYVSVSPAKGQFSGFDVIAKWYTGPKAANSFLPGTYVGPTPPTLIPGAYILANYRGSGADTNISATFTVNDAAATSVNVIDSATGSNLGNIAISGGHFTDTFPKAYSTRIYQVN